MRLCLIYGIRIWIQALMGRVYIWRSHLLRNQLFMIQLPKSFNIKSMATIRVYTQTIDWKKTHPRPITDESGGSEFFVTSTMEVTCRPDVDNLVKIHTFYGEMYKRVIIPPLLHDCYKNIPVSVDLSKTKLIYSLISKVIGKKIRPPRQIASEPYLPRGQGNFLLSWMIWYFSN